MFLVFDTETTGLPRDKNAPLTDFDNWPRVVQLAWQIHGSKGELIEAENHIIRPEGFTIPFNAAKVHGITTEFALQNGKPLAEILEKFNLSLAKSTYIVGHNIEFDRNILGAEYLRLGLNTSLLDHSRLDTCTELTAGFCQIQGGRGGKFKYPNLEELHKKLFQEGFGDAHNASADVEATARCFLELLRLHIFPTDNQQLTESFFTDFRLANPDPVKAIGLAVQSNREVPEVQSVPASAGDISLAKKTTTDRPFPFAHLRNHSTYTILYSTMEISEMVNRAAKERMTAIGLTDTNNLMGAFSFINQVKKHNENELNEVKDGKKKHAELLKAVLGCEINVCRDHTDKTNKDNGQLIPFFAKNKKGYQNLSMLSSLSFTDGFYYVPRVDKNLLLKYKEDIIVTTGSLSGEVPFLLLNVGEHQAEEALLWWKAQFGDDFYIELNRHGIDEEDHLNVFLLQMAEKHQIKYFAANNNHYFNKEDAEAHDFLICIKENAKKDDPIGRGFGFRNGFPNSEFYFKSTDEMRALFSDCPVAIDTVSEIIDKIEPFDLNRTIMLPEFSIPEAFLDSEDAIDHGKRGEIAYLRHLTYEGARKRFGELTEEIVTRLDYELETIVRTKYPGYFLIVQDLINEARRMGVWVGPGRGSAAGSLVAYCTGITNINPLTYGLLFERFLNPDRITMPDIDIDFDDEGRGKVIDYVTQKYGQNKVAQIITYGTLGTKSAIRDIMRSLNYDQIAINKMASSTNNIKLGDFLTFTPEKLKEKYRPEQIEIGESLKKRSQESSDEARILKNTIAIEGLVRNTGIHACGIVITPTDLRELVPVTLSKESSLWATQFDNSVAESAGLLKIDFLGLKTLSLIRDTIEIIQQRRKITLDPDAIPLDDTKSYELFQKGETVGVFQYESFPMQKHLRDLKPTVFTDLIAMNALYRPGPMAYIPNYIKRKQGIEPITYDLDCMREILEETYGITVYQEQVMLLSQKISDFTGGQADTMRKAMGKKNRVLLDELYSKFVAGGVNNGHDKRILEKIWNDWLSFANYAFNKSHSTCYAYIAFQTAYLKANYSAEYMASVLSNNIGDIKQVTFFMEECKRMKLNVLGPDVNESEYKFTVNDKREIRFGLGAIKNMGEAAAKNILEERLANGAFKSVFDFLSRINLRAVNKRNIEALATAGAFDSFEGIHRAQFFFKDNNESQTFLEKAIRFAGQMQEAKNSAQINLFGEETSIHVEEIPFPECQPWSKMKELQMELESIGFYISAHPMDNYKATIRFFTNTNIQQVNNNIQDLVGHKLSFAGQVISAEHLTSQQGKPYVRFKIEDHSASIELSAFSELYLKIKYLIDPGTFVMVNATTQASFRDKEKTELRITDLQLLDSVIEQSSKSVHIRINVSEMDEDQMQQLIHVIKDCEGGRHTYAVHLFDAELETKTFLRPMKGKVDAAKLMAELDQFPFVEFDFR
ncbi:MAG: DNA polymerase III subunit alpha [Bacteroidetes bacterium HGW-Bacteroidetes-1]|jgi:DNA polymerase-3 subunit alpha|nr:MAG: DNA polymerase III subunit alpha [Bacteroidetes bacterium HGW-Bacteroidetes-1]